MKQTVPVAVVIPTFNRGDAVLQTLARIEACDPRPAEIWMHIDAADGRLQGVLAQQYPQVRVLTSPTRLGPGGGRDRCLKSCAQPYAVSFDDDSYPVDSDFFAVAARLFAEHPRVAIFGAAIWHRHEAEKPRSSALTRSFSYTGCGHAIQLAAYRGIRGYLPRPVAYGMEEADLSVQFFAAGWEICDSGELRVFHDTELGHHGSAEITAGTAANIALFAYLNYPVMLWPWGLLQLGNFVGYCLRVGRFSGLMRGLMRIPGDCWRHRRHRRPVALATAITFLRFRRSGIRP